MRRMKRSAAAISVLWLLGLAGPLGAEDLAVGSRVRFRAPDQAFPHVEGTVLSVDENALTLKIADEKDPAVFRRTAIEKLEVRRREGKRFMGGFIGLVTGALIGGIVASSHDTRDCEGNALPCDVKFNSALLGSLGMTIGALAAPGARWEKVPARGVAVFVAPRSDRGLEARVTVRF